MLADAVVMSIALGWLANLPAAVALRWLVARPVTGGAPTRCACGYPRVGLARDAVCPECGVPAPRFAARSNVTPPTSHAWALALGTLVAVSVIYAGALVLLGWAFGTVDPAGMIVASGFVMPATLLACAQVVFPNLGSRRLGFERTARLALGAALGTLGAAIAYAWSDSFEAAASTTSEWQGIGLLLAAFPAAGGTGCGVLASCVGMVIVDARRAGRVRGC